MKQNTALRRQLFVALGLAEKEAVLYDTLLSHGQMAAASLEKISGLKKNTYILLKNLERRGLVQKIVIEGKSHYQVGSPDQLQVYAREQERRVEETKSLLTEMLPELQKNYRDVVGRPVVQHYSGVEGVRGIFEQVYAPGKKDVYGCVGWIEPDPAIKSIVNELAKHRVELGITAHAINNDNEMSRDFEKKAKDPARLAEVHIVNQGEYPFPAEIDVWDNKLAMMSFNNNDFQGILIEHPQIVKTIKSLLLLTFKLLRERKESGYGSQRIA